MAIGERCGWFRAPRILDSDTDTDEIHFEKFQNVMPLWYALRLDGNAKDLLARVGRSLAAIHNHLKLPANMVVNGRMGAEHPR